MILGWGKNQDFGSIHMLSMVVLWVLYRVVHTAPYQLRADIALSRDSIQKR